MKSYSYRLLDNADEFKRVLLISYSPEISLKGKNRGDFVSLLKKNLIARLKIITDNFNLVKNSSRFLVYLSNELWANDEILKRIVKVIRATFGVSSVSFAYQSDLNIENIKKVSLHLFSLFCSNSSSFKVSASRSNKTYYLKSPQINEDVASTILDFINEKKLPVKVDLKHPALTIYIEILNSAFIFVEKIHSVGGLPSSIQGEILFNLKNLTEQNLDDFALSAFLTLRRGIKLLFINSDVVDEKVLNNLVKNLSIFLLPNQINFVDSYDDFLLVVEPTIKFSKEFSSSKIIFPLLSDKSFLYGEKGLMEELINDD